MEADPSIVEYTGESNSSSCGYCKAASPEKFTHGLWAHKLSVDDYNNLLDRGWRRSGKYLYKPTLNRTCCPQYTIRCDANAFRPSKRQKRVLKIVHDFLATGKQPKKCAISATGADRAEPNEAPPIKVINSSVVDTIGITSDSSAGTTTAQTTAVSENKLKDNAAPKETVAEDATKTPIAATQRQLGKKKEMRKQRALLRLAKKGIDFEAAQKIRQAKIPQPKSLEDRFDEPLPPNPAHKLEFRLVRSHPVSWEFSRTLAESHGVYHKYQTVIHGDPPSKPSLSQYRRFLCDSPLNMTIHREAPSDCDEGSFANFLVSSPLNEKQGPSSNPDFPGLGSFHQQYILDGKIIAVGVLDILPRCVSSKYFYYDPDYQFLSLGTYSALVEIALVRKLTKMVPALRWYYMGFYIHSCPKMRYKGRFLPSDLLCPEAFTWVPIEKCLPKLAVSKYARFTEPGTPYAVEDLDMDQVTVLYKHQAMTFGVLRMLRSRTVQDSAVVKEYAQLVGPACAKRMLLYREQ